jgi:hypothetical protein
VIARIEPAADAAARLTPELLGRALARPVREVLEVDLTAR